MSEKRKAITATFPDRSSADAALKQIEELLSLTGRTLDQGALISRSDDGALQIRDLKDTGVRDIVSNAMDLTMFLGKGGAKIALSTTRAGTALLVNSTGRAVGLAGSVAALPFKKLRRRISGDGATADTVGEALAPGTSALVLVVDDEGLNAVTDVLAAAGGDVAA